MYPCYNGQTVYLWFMNNDNHRYDRQFSLDIIGTKGQKKLLDSKVVIVGCGGLGSPAAAYLAGAGIGHLVLIDGDKPSISNVHRQVFFTGKETQSKAEVLKQYINELNAEIKVEAYSQMLSKENISVLISSASIVLECTDHIYTKYLVNDYCHLNRIPVVYGAIYKYEGYISTFENKTNQSIHLRDLFPEPNLELPTCAEVGVMNSIAGIIGLLQANETLKWILNIGDRLIDKLLTYHVLTNEQLIVRLKKAYDEDMNIVYSKNTYQDPRNCLLHEIEYSTLVSFRDKYRLVSIMEEYEHQAIDNEVIHLPMDLLEIDYFKSTDKAKQTVLYCATGNRSNQMVTFFLDKDPTLKILSLKGGLQNIPK